MNQDGFRHLLSRPRAQVAASSAPRPKNLITGEIAKPTQTLSAPPASFKPRKVKENPQEEKHREIAAARTDDKSQFTEIARMVEELRGGSTAAVDSNEATATLPSEELDDMLESALQSTKPPVPEPVAGKKRTREDIIRELKEKRGDSSKGESKPAAKGFKPIGVKDKQPKAQEGEKRKKKKRKIEENGVAASTSAAGAQTAPSTAPVGPPPDSSMAEPDLEPEGFDGGIFAGVGDYEGYDFGSEPEEEPKPPLDDRPQEEGEVSPPPPPVKKNWFDEPVRSPVLRPPTPPRAPSPPPRTVVEEEDSPPMRLQPLASSAVPSIREFLSMDAQEAARDKRKAKKAAWKAKQGLKGEDDEDDASEDEGTSKKKKKQTKEAKLNRDYQRVNAYLEKGPKAS